VKEKIRQLLVRVPRRVVNLEVIKAERLAAETQRANAQRAREQAMLEAVKTFANSI